MGHLKKRPFQKRLFPKNAYYILNNKAFFLYLAFNEIIRIYIDIMNINSVKEANNFILNVPDNERTDGLLES